MIYSCSQRRSRCGWKSTGSLWRGSLGGLLLLLTLLLPVCNAYAQFVLGSASVQSVTPSGSPVGCIERRLIGLTEYWYIQEDRPYTVRITNVTECDGDTIQIVLYDPLRDPNDPAECYEPICLTANRVAAGVYEFTVTFPPPSEKGYYIRYCTTNCDPNTGRVARGSHGTGPANLHLAYFTPPWYDPPCAFLREDKDCPPPGCVKSAEDVELGCNPDPNDIPTDCHWKRDVIINPDSCIVGIPECVIDPNTGLPYTEVLLPDRGPCWRARIFTYRALKCDGEYCEVSRKFIWQEDYEAPEIHNVPDSPVDLGCLDENPELTCEGIIAQYNIYVTDNCDPSDGQYTQLECTAGNIEQLPNCRYRQTFTFSATDKCGNLSGDYTTVLFWKEDTEPPVLHNLPEGGDLGCNPTELPECDPNVTATDNCTENVQVTCTPGPIVTIGCLRIQAFTYTAADECGNTATHTVLYWWTVDTTPPTVRCPGNIQIQLEPGDCFAEVTYRAKAHDDCDPTVRDATCNPPSGTFFPIGVHTVTCSAVDRCGNVGTCSFTVTVLGYICGVKFEDLNGNGLQDPGEPGLPGWTIILLDAGGNQIATTVTGPDGRFCFFGLLPGTYRVEEESRDGWVRTTPDRIVVLPRDCGKTVYIGNRRRR